MTDDLATVHHTEIDRVIRAFSDMSEVDTASCATRGL